MTILADTIVDVASGTPVTQFYIAAKQTRDSTTDRVIFAAIHTIPVLAGAFTTPELEPGPAVVTIGAESYDIDIPDTGTHRLGPLITEALGLSGWYKDPSDIGPYKFTWAEFLASGETVTTQTVTVATGLTQVGTATITDAGTSVTFKVSGGEAGARVLVGCLITTSSGSTFETEKYITVRERIS